MKEQQERFLKDKKDYEDSHRNKIETMSKELTKAKD
jgi:hypothetical protein